MTDLLTAFLRDEMMRAVPRQAHDIARLLAEAPGTIAILFYGSNLRTGSAEGVLDFYVLQDGPPERGLWPRAGYREVSIAGQTVRAKIATMRLATFAKAAAAQTLDTTIWTRFVQPCALVWARDAAAGERVIAAVAAAAVSAARFAAALGPETGAPRDYWAALFAETYAAEFRVESAGRSATIVAHDPQRYDALLPLAWTAAGIAFDVDAGELRPRIGSAQRASVLRGWRARRLAGKPLNLVRLVRAAFTFDGAARYGAWKIERHTGVPVRLTPWRERHPILAAPGVFWRVWRARSRTA
ncbi:hypothetical protein M0208_08130 [Sphingomonas sp. SUN019]|uniref:hypothetical protein n=1 Tax=Sphingomonas sp. SUN019 TaxID=2937788 RepID=UPI002164D216|nr:hypothetical protein [Sphingomonas sp. SUN019]UVO50485.1 hypothetical protein M0208_08130 [Sphingomonas sp. SUN019]